MRCNHRIHRYDWLSFHRCLRSCGRLNHTRGERMKLVLVIVCFRGVLEVAIVVLAIV